MLLSRALGPVGLAVLGLVVFAPGMTHEFTNWDDWKYIVENPIVRSPSLGGVLEAFTSFHFYNYNPLHLVSYMIDAQVWGLWSGGFFLTNLLLHVGTAMVFHELALRCLGSRGAAFTVAALFLVHPTRVESVAWLSERKDVLAGFFAACALLTQWRRWEAGVVGTRSASGFSPAALAFCGLALLSKSQLVGLPLVLLAMSRVQRVPLRAAAVVLLPHAALSAVFSVVTLCAHQGDASGGVQFPESLLVPLAALPRYAILLFAPFAQSPYHDMPLSSFTAMPWVLAGAGMVLGLGFLAAASFRRRGLWLLGVVSFVAFLLPVLGFVRIQVLFAERYLYLALVGPALAAVGTFRDLAGRDSSPRWARCGAVGSAGVWVVGCAMLSAVYLPVFHDSGSLWSRVLTVYPRSSIAHSNLAHHLRAQGRLAEAASHYDADLVEKPCYEESYLGRASIYEAQGQYATAEDLYRHVLSRRPDSVAAKRDYEDFLRRQRARESATK